MRLSNLINFCLTLRLMPIESKTLWQTVVRIRNGMLFISVANCSKWVVVRQL